METELFADIVHSRGDILILLAAQVDATANAQAKKLLLEYMAIVVSSLGTKKPQSSEEKREDNVIPFPPSQT